MKKTILLGTGSLFLLLLCACTSVKRFKSAEYSGLDNSLVDAHLFSTRLSEDPASLQEKNLWALSANAQTRMVQILNERYPDNEQFMTVISSNFGTNAEPVLEYISKDLKMVFSISKSRDYSSLQDGMSRFSPADRIEYLKLSLEIPDVYGLRFNEWNRYSTEYGEIDIADVSFSKNLDLSIDGGPGGVDLGSDASLGRNEKQLVSKRYLKMNGKISDRKVEIEEEGTREADLTGNIIVDVSLQFAGFPEKVMVPVFVTGEDGNSELSALNFEDVVVPAMSDAPDTIYAELRLEYIYRHVAAGWHTYAEWDDKVEYYQGSVGKQVPLFLKRDYLPGFYCIGLEEEDKPALKVKMSPEKEYLLQFREYHHASRFLDWLQHSARPADEVLLAGLKELYYKGEPLTPAEVLENRFKIMPVY